MIQTLDLQTKRERRVCTKLLQNPLFVQWPSERHGQGSRSASADRCCHPHFQPIDSTTLEMTR